jgi:HD-like signal output (HDOD) protein
MKSILFVGTEQPLWQEFRVSPSASQAGWTAAFAQSGAEAQVLAGQNSYAAVVADVHLSDIEGLELLDAIQQEQPHCFTIVLSDFADTDSTIQCMGRGHHHLSRPCNLSTLLAALEQTTSTQEWVPSSAAQNLITRMKRVPSPPSVYFQVVAEIQSPEASVERIGEIISRDPAIAVKVLQLANSAVFGLQLQVIQPAEAVAFIGLQTTKSLVLLAHSFATFDQVRLAGFSVESLWSHSVATGKLARQIAQAESGRPEIVDQSFTAGLLHDMGKLLFAANLPREFSQTLSLARGKRLTASEAELQVYGVTHAEIGGSLLGIWGLPKPIVEAVALHHEPSQLTRPDFSPLSAVHVANVLIRESAPEHELSPREEFDDGYVRKLGLEPRISEWRTACATPPEPVLN